MILRAFFSDFIDLIFPRCCTGCDQPLIGSEATLCTFCRISLPRIGQSGLHADTLRYKFVNEPRVLFTHSFLLFTKKSKVQKLLHALKYRGNQEIGLVLGQMFGQEMQKRRNTSVGRSDHQRSAAFEKEKKSRLQSERFAGPGFFRIDWNSVVRHCTEKDQIH
ncbi:hypothetical protein DYBT9623_04966 [Dyadobacter sp. CECT 9623]|uniref:Amidophosphoribosyltransferase n=1 Tax=Dyadobacter linearis TaxID=2823330 RepID=A0ABN7RG79_9BACT|nr:hypothetical protein DYBT9623_04966 [Dyadobacter sp. CECT 9623]